MYGRYAMLFLFAIFLLVPPLVYADETIIRSVKGDFLSPFRTPPDSLERTITVPYPDPRGGIVPLTGRFYEVTTPSAQIAYEKKGELVLRPLPYTIQFIGINGASDLYASVLMTAAGPLGIAQAGNQLFSQVPLRMSADEAKIAFSPVAWSLPPRRHCGVQDDIQTSSATKEPPERDDPYGTSQSGLAAGSHAFRLFDLVVQVDYELFQSLGLSERGVIDAVVSFVGVLSALYQRETNIAVRTPFVAYQATLTPDPYKGTDVFTTIDEFQNYWNGHRWFRLVNRDGAMFLSNAQLGDLIGLANTDTLCQVTRAYSVVTVFGDPQDPNYLVENALTAIHELGHTLGSPHTHCYDPPLDLCSNIGDNCYSGPTSEPIPPAVGTIMSYCNAIETVFHPRTVERFQHRVTYRGGCLRPLSLRALMSGVTVADVQGTGNDPQYFAIDVPAGSTNLSIETSGGIGNADLIVAKDYIPDIGRSFFDFRSGRLGNNERLDIHLPTSGNYYLLLYPSSYLSWFRGVNLTATIELPEQLTELQNGIPHNIDGAIAGEDQLFRFVVPEGARGLEIKIEGGQFDHWGNLSGGDADLYVRMGELPSLTEYDNQPSNDRYPISDVNYHEERFVVDGLTCLSGCDGAWYVLVHTEAPFLNVDLTASFR